MAGRDFTGQVFGSLTVVRPSPRTTGRRKIWLCICKCGAEVEVRPDEFANRKGCKQCTRAMLKHGHWVGDKATRTHEAWRSMKKRCSLPKNAAFKSHGGRGITVCDRWQNSFENFLSDMGEAPEGMSLDRYPDNNGPYSPANCRWATAKQQGRNKRTNRLITAHGQTLTLSEWGEKSGIHPNVIAARLSRGWRVDIAVTDPPQIYRRL